MRPHINILIPSSRWKHAQTTGDFFFAKSLGAAFQGLGVECEIVLASRWYEQGHANSVDLVLRGYRPYHKKCSRPSLMWVIYPGRTMVVPEAELEGLERVFFASEQASETCLAQFPSVTASSLLQAFDPEVMHCKYTPERHGIVFVGSLHRVFAGSRSMVSFASAAGVPIQLWGMGWSDLAPVIDHRGSFVENRSLGDLYRAAEIVLCDHMPSMLAGGYVSNRIFDALACGAPVISDRLPSLPSGFERFVEMVSTPEEFRLAVEKIRAEGPEMKRERLAFARSMVAAHSFDARARQIVEAISTN